MATATRQPVSDSAESATATQEAAPKKKHPGGRPSNKVLEERKLAQEAKEAEAAQAIADQSEEEESAIAETLGFKKPASLDFFEWMSQTFSPEQWESDLFIYLWRSAPTIDRKGQGRGSAIAKYAEFIDTHRIMLDQGSGDYRIDLCIVTQPNGKMNRLAQHRFQILNMDFPPKVPPGDWLDDPANSMWGWARGAIEAAAAQRNQTAANGAIPGMYDPAAMFSTIATTFKSMQPEKQGTDPAIVAILQSLLEKGKAAATPDPMVTFLLEELKSQREEARQIRQELRDQANKGNAPAKSILEQLTELDPLIQRLTPKGRAPAEDNSVMAIVKDVGLRLVDNLPQLLAAWNMGMTGRVPGFTQPGQTVQATAAAPATMTAPAAIPSQEHVEPMRVTPQQEAIMAAVLQKHGDLFQQCGAHMMDMFKNTNGYDFRDWFIDRHSREKWLEVKGDTGPQIMVDLIQGHTFLRTQIAPPEAALKFFTDFFDEEGDGEDEEEADIPAGVGELKQ